MTLPLPAFESARVLIIGDLMVDQYWHGKTTRISPEAPVPVVAVQHSEVKPGGAANVAINIARYGAQVTLLGIVGEDEAGSELQQMLESAKVKCEFVQSKDRETIKKLRVISHQQQLIRMDFEDCVLPTTALDQLQQCFRQACKNVDVVILSDYAKGALAQSEALIAIANEQRIPVFVDPKGQDFSKYTNATLLTPNMAEFEAIVGPCTDEDTITTKAMALIDSLACDALLVTRGERGMSLFRKSETPIHLPAQAREVFDVTGAGDTVIGTLAAAHAAGAPIDQATALANLAAGLVVSKLGTATLSVAELRQALFGNTVMENESGGVVIEERLIELTRAYQAQGKKVVFTNGCFDILHPGHVSYLNEAKRLGDRLIVAVNSDASVKKLKGEERPINRLEDRMAVLLGLSSVDWVISFSEETPLRLISAVLPNVLVKGGDYRPEDIVGGAEVLEHGGEVKVLPFVDGCSTSNIIDAIKTS